MVEISEERLRELEDWDMLVQAAEALNDDDLVRLEETLRGDARRSYWQADRLRYLIRKREEAREREKWYAQQEATQ
jgi:hypothetical protein